MANAEGKRRAPRSLVLVLVGIVVAVAGAIGVGRILGDRDAPGVGTPSGPGREHRDQGARHVVAVQRGFRYSSDPPTSGPHRPLFPTGEPDAPPDALLHALELGNVVLYFGARTAPVELRRFARAVAGPFDRALAASGQAVILARRPGTDGVIAAAWRRSLEVGNAGDPALREFAEHWLGQGASR